jgi:hypothetical protein
MSHLNKTSLLVSEQLPEFIRGDVTYSTFVAFLKAYYEWMELANTSNSLSTTANSYSQGALYASKNVPEYMDIDTTLDDFVQFFRNDFLSFFPSDADVDEKKLIKIARQLYNTKGTPASYEFLFRVLYNSDVQLFNSKDYVFKASDGKWVTTNVVTIQGTDPVWTLTIGYRLFGLTSTGYATIESVNIVPIEFGGYTQIFVTDVGRNFISGETVQVQNTFGAKAVINGNEVTGVILGIVNSVSSDPANLGSGYSLGDPVVFYGGLVDNIDAYAAKAYVSSVSEASVQKITTVYAGHGYNVGNTDINIISATGGVNATGFLFSTDNNPYTASFVNIDTIQSFIDRYEDSVGNTALNPPIGNSYYLFGNTSNTVANVQTINVNSRLVDSLYFANITTYGVGIADVSTGGRNYQQVSTTANALGTFVAVDNSHLYLSGMGTLAPIQIINGGLNYANGDTVVFTGGGGFGAYAYVNVAPFTGQIVSTTYIGDPAGRIIAPLGGMGYGSSPALTVSSTHPSHGGAVLFAGLMGADAVLQPTTGTSGQVLGVTLTSPGVNYISKPTATLRVTDLLVYNNDFISNPLTRDDVIIQTNDGKPVNSTANTQAVLFIANVASVLDLNTPVTSNNLLKLQTLRIYNYNGTLNTSSNIIVYRNGSLIGANLVIDTAAADQGLDVGFINGVHQYGSGTGKAIVNFSSGVQIGAGATFGGLTSAAGHYVNSDGQPSGYSILENDNYNTFSYFLKVEKALEEYKNSALKFLHPAGLHYVAFNMIKSSMVANTGFSSQEFVNSSLLDSAPNFTANTVPNSNTIVIRVPYVTENIQAIVPINSFLSVNPIYGEPFYSQVQNVADTSVGTNYKYDITLADYWINSVPNVAYGKAVSGTSKINISNTTSAWTMATGQKVTNISDIAHVNDTITFNTSPTGLGVLQPITIVDGGGNYFVGNTISIVGGGGYGAYANITSVSGIGAITGISYVKDPSGNTVAPLGGINYTTIPTVTAIGPSTGYTPAKLVVPGFLTYQAANTAKISDVTNTTITLSGVTFTDNVMNIGPSTWLTTNGVMTLTRNVYTSNVFYSGPVQPIVLLELITENGDTLTTESGLTLLIG